MIRIVLADDHMIVRQGFQQLLSQQPDFEVVGAAGDGAAALRLVEELRPDVLVLDMVMPGLSGLEVLERMQQAAPQARVVVLSMHDDQAYVLQALRSGALAYLLKESSAQDLIQAIRVVMSGWHYLSAPVLEQMIAICLRGESNGPEDRHAALSSREREVLKLIATGLDNRQITAALAVKKRTVDTYRRRLIQKLGLQSQADLLRYALQHHQPPHS
jgi:two-component system, NarL family, response regulator NreC